KFLDIMIRFADYVATIFENEEGKIPGYPGHQEIELALVKLFDVTGNEKYLQLSKYFIEQRGKKRSEEHTSELQSRFDLVCRLLLEKKNVKTGTSAEP